MATTKAKTEVGSDKPIIPKDIDQHELVIVKNGFQGKLIYKSPRTGELFEWDEFGDEQEMEIRELRNVKSSAKAFFINNWFMFDEEYSWVIDYLGLKQFYKDSILLDRFDEIFTMTPDKIKKIVSKMPDGQKKSVSYRARELIIAKEIDSIKVINALESALGTKFIEG